LVGCFLGLRSIISPLDLKVRRRLLTLSYVVISSGPILDVPGLPMYSITDRLSMSTSGSVRL